MSLIHPTSLVLTIDSAAEELFFQRSIDLACQNDLASMLVSRQVHSGINSGFFICFTSESPAHLRLFTGEILHTEFACRHLTLIEAARLLVLLPEPDYLVSNSIQLASQRMENTCYSSFCSKGECKPLTIAYMRYLAASVTDENILRLESFLGKLSAFRDNKGKWHGFPFFYTLLMLGEIHDLPAARQELEYAAHYADKQISQVEAGEPYSNRRKSILNTMMMWSVYNASPLLLGQYG